MALYKMFYVTASLCSDIKHKSTNAQCGLSVGGMRRNVYIWAYSLSLHLGVLLDLMIYVLCRLIVLLHIAFMTVMFSVRLPMAIQWMSAPVVNTRTHTHSCDIGAALRVCCRAVSQPHVPPQAQSRNSTADCCAEWGLTTRSSGCAEYSWRQNHSRNEMNV